MILFSLNANDVFVNWRPRLISYRAFHCRVREIRLGIGRSEHCGLQSSPITIVPLRNKSFTMQEPLFLLSNAIVQRRMQERRTSCRPIPVENNCADVDVPSAD